MVSIHLLENDRPGKTYPLEEDSLVIGRHRTCDVVIGSDTVSRRHTRIFSQDGGFYVEDLKSTNGTFLNDVQVRRPRRLKDGDVIRVNRFALLFDAEQHRDTADSSFYNFPTSVDVEFLSSSVEPEIVASLNVWDADQRANVSPEAKLRAMIEIMRCLDNSLDRDKLLPRVLEGLARVFPQAERLYILMADGPHGRLKLQAIKHCPPNGDETVTTGPISRTIAQRVMQDRKAVLSADALVDARFEQSDSVQDWHVRSMMCAPLTGPTNQPLGVIHVDTQDPRRQFAQIDLDVLASVATLVGQSLEHCRLHEAYLRSERLSAIGQMMAGLAHESRNALQRSQACLERLALRVRDQADSMDLIARIQTAQDQLHQLYEQVQRYAAPITMQRKSYDLGDILQTSWEHLEPIRQGRSVRLHTHLDEPINRICEVDLLAMERVFCNLLENAISATSGPVDISIDWLEDTIGGRDALRIAVHDNGPGMSNDQRGRVFEPFYTTKVNGTGLGLALTKRNVEAHDGWISVADVDGPGATFLVTLPRKAAPVE
ncbi:ATP-binding protein [Lignipirellula cremea]|uniref:histidine kinase n=1 Tax=Lignipirellula cremea TaxID=2528010 RepID=A0A518DX97_9BACT|nr:ATP-binding protein [Lignipirellula cremea]QDU96459.1 Sensor protein ZraS [Lignipirellula cremea]